MSRLFEIYDSRGSRQYADKDLPLTIGKAPDAGIFLESGQEIEGYIDDSRGHLFFQPSGSTSHVFHNNQLISASVWIKSDDTTRIGSTLLHYRISGDLVEIRLSTVTAKTTIMPPDSPPPDAGKKEKLPRIPPENNRGPRAGSRVRRLVGLLLLTLLLAAAFVLTAKSLEVTITPEPDSLSISGFPPAVKLGHSFLGLKGDYTLKAEKQGYQPLETKVTISDGISNRYAFPLVKMPGLVDFHTTPVNGAEILIDDGDVGLTPVTKQSIPAGPHLVRVTRDRYLPHEQTIDVEGLGREQRFDFTLSPAWSAVTLTTEPPGADIVIDGNNLGKTPATLELLTGDYTLVFSKNEYAASQLRIAVPPGQTLAPDTVVMTLAPAHVELTSTPPDAMVTVDAVYQGQTPLNLTLSAKTGHTLVLSRQGFENLQEEITLNPDETRSLSLELRPEYGIIFLTTDPPNAELYINGKHKGKATGRFELEAREHVFEIRSEGYKTATRKVTPSKEYSRQVDILLEPAQKTVVSAKQAAGNTTTRGGQKMILLQPSSFQMGTSRREPGTRANEKLREVRITRPYYLAAGEVTNEEFRQFKPDHSSGTIAGYSLNGDKQPAVNVTWDDAARYLNWLSSQDNLKPFYREENGTMVPVKPMTTGYRLPFESEWAYAARYVDRKAPSRYPWSGPFPPPAGSGNFADESSRGLLPVVISGYNDSFPVSAPPASFPNNAGGFFDIGGNVSEWCHDYYTPYSGFSQKEEIDPMGPATGSHHVVRGASWRDGSITELRLSYRSYSNQVQDDLGFRFARFAQ